MTAGPTPSLDFWGVLNLIGQQFPQFVPLLSEPGMFDIFKQAVDPATAAEWSPARVNAAVGQTPWFKNQTAAQRSWYVLDITDPATAQQKKDDAGLRAFQVAVQLGVHLTPYDQAIVGLNAAVNGWDDTRIRAELVAKNAGAGNLGPGGIGDQMTQFHGMANDQGVPIDDNTLYQWAAATQAGTKTQEGFRDFVTQQAINLYPALTPALKEGQTVKQYASSYFSQAANELGINPQQIDLANPKWVQTFIGADDAGNQHILNLNQSLAKIRTDPAYGYDQGLPGRTQAAQFAAQLQQKFGVTG